MCLINFAFIKKLTLLAEILTFFSNQHAILVLVSLKGRVGTGLLRNANHAEAF